MGKGAERIRLTSRDLFVYYFKKIGKEGNKVKLGGCTNKRMLSKRTSVEYNTLMRTFTRKGGNYYENEDVFILKIYTSGIEKGSQSIGRRGKGGMENFIKNYIRQTNY